MAQKWWELSTTASLWPCYTDTKPLSLFLLRASAVSLHFWSTHTTQRPKHKAKLFEKSKQTFPTDSLQGRSQSDGL